MCIITTSHRPDCTTLKSIVGEKRIRSIRKDDDSNKDDEEVGKVYQGIKPEIRV